MNRSSAFALSFGLALLAVPAAAEVCTVDDVPAATLLLPYFEVDLEDPDGVTTLFSINNASATAVLAHVVVWSDLSVPVLDFNVYLTGYDVQSVNLRDVLVGGTLPRTASDGQDPQDTISPQGDFSQDVNFASCAGQLPPPMLPALFTTHLQNSLTGQFSSILGGCAGLDHGDRIARGYVTVDTVNNCTLRFPGDPGYFVAGGQGDATNQNVLWGDYFYVYSGQSFAQGETLVHVEADATDPETSVPGEYTFYGRYVAWTAADNREPLATDFAVRYLNGGAFDGGTDLLVWRDAKVNQGAFKCGTLPAWYPLGQEGIVIFDEQENPQLPESFPVSPQPPGEIFVPFGAEALRVAVDGPDLPVDPDFGWLYLGLSTQVIAAGDNPPEDPLAAQAWVTAVMDADGRFSVGFDALTPVFACASTHAFFRPDLVPALGDSQRFCPSGALSTSVSLAVANQGTILANGSTTRVNWTVTSLQGPMVESFNLSTPAVPGGESVTIGSSVPSCLLGVFPQPPTCGLVSIAARVDVGEVVFEGNEGNNVQVIDCPPPAQ